MIIAHVTFLSIFSLINAFPLTLKKSLSTYDLFLQLGPNKVTQQFELDLSIDFLWLCMLRLDEADIERTQNTFPIKIINEETKGELLEASITFQNTNITLSSFPFYFVMNRGIPGFDSFPLAFSFKNKSLSIIHTLCENNIIDSLSFGFSYQENDQYLYIGSLPEDLTNEYKYKRTIKVNKEYKTWGTVINNIIMGKYTFNTKYYGYFQANTFPISAPKELITFLYETVFKEYLEQGQCTIVHDSFSNYISCQCNILNEMNDIQISFNDTVIPISITYLIKSDNSNRCTLQIKENEIDRDIEKFIFGISFLTQYPSLFDYEDESITFFSNNPFSPSNDISFSPPKKILSVLIILIIINILLLFISKRDFISEFEFIK